MLLAASSTAGGLAMMAVPTLGRAQAKRLKAGIILPLSGVLSFPGIATRRGSEVALKMFAEQGSDIEAVWADTESKPENGRVAAERLIRDGCTVLIGAWDSGATISAAQACEAAKVPLVVNVASAPQLTEQGFTQIFSNFPRADTIVANGLEHFKGLLGPQFQPKTAVLMHVNDTFGQAVAGAVKALWKKFGVGIEILDTISYDARARDLSVEVGKAKATGAELLAPVTRVNDAILIVREMVKQAWNPMAIYGPSSPGPYEKAFTDALGKYANDYLVSVPWYDQRRPLTRQVLERWKKAYPDARLELNSGFGWESIQIVADAFKRAGSTAPADLHAALRKTSITEHIMTGGPIAFNEKGLNTNIAVPLLQVRDQEPVVVAPKDFAQTTVRLPMARWDAR
ncbi:MAG: ABC transporter substrate-binding protein [Lautropia sp.]